MSNSTNIAALKRRIEDTLLPLVNDDYSLLDAPNHNNIGDSLIYEGELAFLQGVPFRSLYKGTMKFSPLKSIPPKGILLMHGGGNFGDLWPLFQNYRRKVIAERTSQRVIIFPQTVYYENTDNLEKDVAVFSAHPDLIICARDQRSYEFLNRHFTNNKILRLPDMAFCLNLDRYRDNSQNHTGLVLERRDKELRSRSLTIADVLRPDHQANRFEVADWPGIERERKHAFYWKWKKRVDKYLTRLLIWLGSAPKDSRNFGVFQSFNSHKRLEDGVHFINRYDVVVTTRLHGLILALLLDKPVYILDNSYGKNSQFYETWLRNFDHCYLIE